MPNDDQSWLADIVVINESPRRDRAADITIFRSQGDACNYLEPWFVEEVSFFALSGIGTPIQFSVRKAKRRFSMLEEVIIVESKEAFNDDLITLTNWLFATAEHLLEVRRYRAQKQRPASSLGNLEAQGVLPTTVEGLIAYIGFNGQR